jgi:S-(hydroxymethyl)glutathione dehydrogenase/alcohol dehydrogenase
MRRRYRTLRPGEYRRAVTPVRAAVCRSFGAPFTLETLDLRDAGPGEVRVRVAACAICHSDVAYARGVWGGDLPAVYGHEASGVVEEVGAGVVAAAPGDHVVVTLVRSCGHCPPCLRGLPSLCERRGELPLSRSSPLRDASGAEVAQGLRTGGFAEQVLVHESQVVPIPEDVPLASAALVGCGVVTGAGAVLNTARAEAGSTVGVIGAGGVGLNSIQGAALAGARLVVGIDVVSAKLEAAADFGAGATLDGRGDVPAAVAELTGGRGLDTVVVTAGSAAAVEQALALVADAGSVVLVGMPGGATASIDPEAVAERGIRILGSKVGSTRPQLDVPALVELYRSGRLKLDELVSARFPLAEIDDAFALAEGGEALRVVLEP